MHALYPRAGRAGMILSFAAHRDARQRAARLRTAQPYCGPCFDVDGEINDLVPIKLWANDGRPVMGHYCGSCGQEFQF